MAALDSATVLVACPLCGAEPGHACPTFTHLERIRAAEHTFDQGA